MVMLVRGCPMRKALATTLLWIVIYGTASAGTFDKVPQNATPEWKIGCESQTVDQFGDAKQQYCSLSVYNYHIREQLMEDNSYLIRSAVILYIDRQGLRLNLPRKADALCKTEPKRIAVDGNRIDQLILPEQIDRLAKGRVLVWEQQAEWPYCGVAPHGTNLHGIGPAIEELKQEWGNVSSGWDTTLTK